MARAFLSLGSNLGDRKAMLEEALHRLEGSGRLNVVKTSSLYTTEPVGKTDQPWFYNLVAEIETESHPEGLLDLAQQIEQELKRTRTMRWGPRTIDIDILLYNGLTIATDRLMIPHPQMTRRRFVLEPLHEIAPDFPFPDGRRAADFLPDVAEQEVRKVEA